MGNEEKKSLNNVFNEVCDVERGLNGLTLLFSLADTETFVIESEDFHGIGGIVEILKNKLTSQRRKLDRITAKYPYQDEDDEDMENENV